MNSHALRQLAETNSIIEELMKTESSDVLMIDYLSVVATREEASFLWRQVLQSRRSHYDWLRGLFYQMNGRWPEVDQEIFQPPSTYEEGLDIQIRRLENRKVQMMKLMNQTITLYVHQSLQIIYNQMQYEELLLRQLQRFE
ncbi:hypothetical protein RYX56_15830 [Alkalihalophilus lindianensis]|uniref:DUF2383 domain-containing protein n=1 Tax=Alkalihalophilus lindianensis TaxID=1630542 RepID=A0ABU3XD83_9BACI|nr:hypothetical protein [Alkalihalophilus lindianensis]MDV2685836.1 hypothetical protein [Alkalihalophilus lindianensis]